MGFGLFGKLPQKRDFIALSIPHSILHPFETWLQSAVAASRNELGRDWEEHFLVAPIWRFWLGHEIFGQSCTGALMPSVDKVGRFFPLSIMNFSEPGRERTPPPFQPRDEWYAAIDERLLSVLGEDVEIEVETLTNGLAEPDDDLAAPTPQGELFKGGLTFVADAAAAGDDFMASLVRPDYWRAAASRSYWWTSADAGSRIAHVRPGLPDPYFFTRMLRGVAH